MRLAYDPTQVPSDLYRALTVLGANYPISATPTEGAVKVDFEGVPGGTEVTVQVKAERAAIRYGTVAQACRGVGLLLGLDEGSETVVREQAGFDTLGLMVDCSRNAVARPAYLERWLCRMALAGYNMLMLYTEDTYELPEEPLFGYLRGAYTRKEIRQIDDYADALGIELIPCIQTLGHLEQILKWRREYSDVRDTSSVLLVDEPETYALIDKMVSFWSKTVRSRRIHIGMDETHDLGRGQYMDRFGYRKGFDIFNAHLDRVVAICRTQGMDPMIWSDMYFRMGSRRGDYYDLDSEIPDEVARAIPQSVQLVYWDYYHTTEAFYQEWIRRHRQMGFEPIMGSGIWTWGRLVYSQAFTSQTMLPCVRACLAEGVRELFFTMWKDDGGAVDFDSADAGVLLAAEAAYNGGQVVESRWATRFRGVCRARLEDSLSICGLDPCERYEDGEVNARMLLWEDPLMGLYRRTLWARADVRDLSPAVYYARLADELSARCTAQGSGVVGWVSGGDLGFAQQLAHTLALKAAAYDRLVESYVRNDRAVLAELAQSALPELVDGVKTLWRIHRRVWMAQNKAMGFEVMCVRYGGLLLRLEEAAARIHEYLRGDIDQIEELERVPEPLSERLSRYRMAATPSSIL